MGQTSSPETLVETLKMGQTSSPETLVSYQKTTPGKNPKDFIQHYDRGNSLQSHIFIHLVRFIFVCTEMQKSECVSETVSFHSVSAEFHAELF
jgi:hypothetical protein